MKPSRIPQTAWEIAVGSTYVLTEDDVVDGRNKLGCDVSNTPLNVPLCNSCDTPVGRDGLCYECEIIFPIDHSGSGVWL